MPHSTKKSYFKKKKTRNNKKIRKQRRTRRKSKKGGALCGGEQGISITDGCKPGRYSIIDIKNDGIYLVLGMTNNPIWGIKRKHEVIKWDEKSKKFNFPYLYKKLIRFKLDRYKNWEYIYTMDNSNKQTLISQVDTYVTTDIECANFFSNAYNKSTDNNTFIRNIESEINKRKMKKEYDETMKKTKKAEHWKKYLQSQRKGYEAALEKERKAAAMEEEKVKNMTPEDRRFYYIQQKREKEYEQYLPSTLYDNIIPDVKKKKSWEWDPEN